MVKEWHARTGGWELLLQSSGRPASGGLQACRHNPVLTALGTADTMSSSRGKGNLQGQDGDHMALRQKAVSFMRQHRADFEPYMEDDEPFDAYCKRMAEVGMHGIPAVGGGCIAVHCIRATIEGSSVAECHQEQSLWWMLWVMPCACLPAGAQEGTWAGQQEQVAVARLFGVVTHIYQAGQPLWSIKPGFADFPEVFSAPDIFVAVSAVTRTCSTRGHMHSAKLRAMRPSAQYVFSTRCVRCLFRTRARSTSATTVASTTTACAPPATSPQGPRSR